MGDIGGLIDAIYYFLSLLLVPFLQHNYQSFMLHKLFRSPDVKPSESDASKAGPEPFSGALKPEVEQLKTALKTAPRI